MEIKDYLEIMVDKNASDMFYRSGGPVHFRLNGKVISFTEDVINMNDMNLALKQILSDEAEAYFKKNLDVDFGYYCPEIDHRFRVSVFTQRNTPSIVVRNVPVFIDSMDTLGLPSEVLKKLALESRGMVLVTGTMGSGKSTAIAGMIEYMNSNTNKHILTLENPVEYVFKDGSSIINQRELTKDVASYPAALRAFALHSPDVIYIGNIRDCETMTAALAAAETGALVLSTLDTVNAAQTIERIVNFFPPHQHRQIQAQLSLLLKGVISLKLVPLKDGTGRVPACETMLLTPAIGRLIREGKVREINSHIENGAIYGMRSFNQSLVRLVEQGRISAEAAAGLADSNDGLSASNKPESH